MSTNEEAVIFSEIFHCESHAASNECNDMDSKKRKMPVDLVPVYKYLDCCKLTSDTCDDGGDNISVCEDPLGSDICDDVKDFSFSEEDIEISRETSFSIHKFDVDTSLTDTTSEDYERYKDISSPLDKMVVKPTKSNEDTASLCQCVATESKTSLFKVGGNGDTIEEAKEEQAKKMYSCKLCSKSYAWRRSLRKHHVKVHLNEFLFCCKICQKKFRDAASLDNHTKLFHRKCFKCNVCRKVYFWETSLRRHMQLNHKDALLKEPDIEFPCQLCKKAFRRKDSLRRHRREVHNLLLHHTCEVCQLDFQKASSLMEHLKTHKTFNDIVYICEDEPSNDATQSDGMPDPVSVHDDHIDNVPYDPVSVNDHDRNNFQNCSVGVNDHYSDNRGDSAFGIDCYKDNICDDSIKVHGNSISTDSLSVAKSFTLPIDNKVSVEDNKDFKNEHINNGSKLDEKPKIPDAVPLPENTVSNDQLNHCKLCSESLPLGESLKRHIQNYHGKSYSCPFCDRRFFQKESLTKHQAQAHPNDFLYCCELCQKKFRTKTSLRCHMEVHHNKEYNCNICGKIFIWEATLQKHLEVDHKDDNFSKIEAQEIVSSEHECHICEKSYQTKKSLTRHLREVHGGLSFVNCKICEQKFINTQALGDHMKAHMSTNDSGTIRYNCSYCKLTYCDTHCLIDHMKTHTEGAAICGECGKDFTCFKSLKKHKMLHSKNESIRFLCDICGKGFKNNKHFGNHLRTHTGPTEKNFKCPLCDKCFRDNFRLMTHKRKHTGEKPFLCSICGKGFMEKRVLDLHTRSHLNNKGCKCTICGKEFTYPNYLSIHMRSHTNERPYSCNVCHKDFTQKSSLNLHMKSHSEEKKYLCQLCGKSFSLQHYLAVHMRTHTGEKPFKCSICERSFSQKSSLNTHTRSCH